jgi:hypothetical protein
LRASAGELDRDARGACTHGWFWIATESLQPRFWVDHIFVVTQIEQQFQSFNRVGVRQPATQ